MREKKPIALIHMREKEPILPIHVREKKLIALIHVQEKGIIMEVFDEDAGGGVEQRYWPHAMGSEGEVKQTSMKGNCPSLISDKEKKKVSVIGH